MSTRTGGGFGGCYLEEHLLKRKRTKRWGDYANYLSLAHYERVQHSYRKRVRRARALGKRPPQPPAPPRVWDRT